MIRTRTIWQHYIGGLAFRTPRGDIFRLCDHRLTTQVEGTGTPHRRGEYWPCGRGYDLRIVWWRTKRASRIADERAWRRGQ